MNGYDFAAFFMSENPRTMIVRRFSKLALKNLLYRQMELEKLEQELAEIASYDGQSEETSNFQYSWEELHQAQSPYEDQWKKFLEARGKLEEYCKSAPSSISVTLPILLTLD
jgi:hypothetical protein